MNDKVIDCLGFKLGDISVPPFELNVGEFKQIQWLFSEKDRFLKIVTGKEKHPALKIFKPIDVVSPPISKNWFSWIFDRQTAKDYLLKNTIFSNDDVMDVLQKFNIHPNLPIHSMGLTQRLLLALEIAWTQVNVVIFTTAGLDPLGVETICESVKARLDGGASLHVSSSTPNWFSGQEVIELQKA